MVSETIVFSVETVGCLDLSNRPNLIRLPAGMTVGGYLDLSGCTGLTGLPAGLQVSGDLYLHGCTGLIELPEDMKVGHDLYLIHTGISVMPVGLKVDGLIIYGPIP